MRSNGVAAVLVGGCDETAVAGQLEQLLHRFVPGGQVVNLTGHTTLKRLGATLRACDMAMTNDSGPMHLAAAVGTPVLGMFTCTSPYRSGPSGDKHELVFTNVRCAASYRKRCPKRGSRHLACMEELTTERAWQAMMRLMVKNRIGRQDERIDRAA